MPPRLPAFLTDRRLAVLGHLAVALLVTAPMMTAPLTRMIGHPDVDVWNHAWGLWWFWDSFVHGEVPVWTALLNAPKGGWLWFIDPIGGAMGAGLVPLVGVIAAWNMVIFTLIALASVAGRRLALALGAGPRASWVGAIGIAASAHVISEVHNGISEAVGVCWPVFALGALLRAIQSPEQKRLWAITGVLGGITVLGTYYYALSLGLTAGVLLLMTTDRARLRPVAYGVAIGASIALCFAVPVVLTIHHTVADPTTAIIPRQTGDWHDRFWALQHNAVDPLSLFIPGNFQSVDLASLGEAFRHTSYLGWVVLVPAVRAHRRRWLWAALLPILFSLGPFLWVDGHWLRLGTHLVALPYRFLLDVLPSGAIAHPQRLGFVGIALVVGLGASRISERHAPYFAAALLVELLLLSPAPWPVARTPALDTRYAAAILETVRGPSAGKPRAPVVDVPAEEAGHGMSTSRYLLFQTVHHQPIPYGPNVRADGYRMFENQVGFAAVFGHLDQLQAIGAKDLRQVDSGWLALHTDLGDTTALQAALTDRLGAPQVYGPVWLWDLRQPDGSDAAPGPPLPDGRPLPPETAPSGSKTP